MLVLTKKIIPLFILFSVVLSLHGPIPLGEKLSVGARVAHAQYPPDEAADFMAVGITPPSPSAVPLPQALDQASPQKSIFGWAFEKIGDAIIDGALALFEWLARIFFNTCGWFMMAMGAMFDFALGRSLNSELINNLGVINAGWTITRDVANMFFIFLLLYIAIQTILGLMGHQTKVLLRNIIIVALLINFSLFITKVVIDATNIFALAFLYKIETQIQDPNGTMTVSHSPTVAIQSGLKLQTLFLTNRNIADPSQKTVRGGEQIMVYLGGGVFMLIAGYVFLAGAMLFVIRLAVFIFCMIFAPLAFLGLVLPKMSVITHKWWDALLSNALVAPVFCFMMYLVVRIIRSQDLFDVTLATNANYAQAFVGTGSNWMIIYNFIFLISLLIGTLSVSRAVAGKTAGLAIDWAKKGTGVQAGAVGFAARHLIGRTAQAVKESKWAQESAQKTGLRKMMGSMTVRGANFLAKSSMDLRNAPVVGGMIGLGAGGGKGGYRAWRREKDDKIIKRAEELFPNNPLAQEQYIRDHTKQFPVLGQSRFDQKPGPYVAKEDQALKQKRESLDKEKTVLDAKTTLKAQAEAAEAYENAKREKERLEAERKRRPLTTDEERQLAAAAASIDESNKAIANALEKLTPRDVAGLGADILGKKHIQEQLTGAHLSAILAHDKEKGYDDPQLLNTMGRNILDSKNAVGRNTLRKLIGTNPGAFGIDLKKDIENFKDTYDTTTDPSTKADLLRNIGKLMGYMDPGDIKDWDEELLKHPTIAGSMTKQHLASIAAKQKNDGSLDDDTLETIARTIAVMGNRAAQAYIRGRRGDDVFARYAHMMPPPPEGGGAGGGPAGGGGAQQGGANP